MKVPFTDFPEKLLREFERYFVKKRCSCCGCLLPVQNFYVKKDTWIRKRSGERVTREYYFSECKVCYTERVKLYNSKHKEQVASAGRKFRAKTPSSKNKGLLRRAERESTFPNDGITKKEVFVRDGGVCYACGVTTSVTEGEMDHLIGYALPDCPGNVWENVSWMCKPCNRSKPKKHYFKPAIILFNFQILVKGDFH